MEEEEEEAEEEDARRRQEEEEEQLPSQEEEEEEVEEEEARRRQEDEEERVRRFSLSRQRTGVDGSSWRMSVLHSQRPFRSNRVSSWNTRNADW